MRAWSVEAYAWPALGVVFLAGTLGRAMSKPLWHDEIFTLYLATRTTLDGLWSALAAGVDLNPPLYYVLVRVAAAVVGAGALADRLPSLVGYVIAMVAGAIVARRLGGSRAGLLAALVLALTGASMYAYEGRAYGLVLGLSAVAFAAWQQRGRASAAGAPILCAISLAAAACAHYYAVLMLVPLGVGEAIRSAERRRIDWGMAAALVASLLPLAALYSLVHTARTFAPAFWSPPTPGDLADCYRLLLEPLAIPFFAAGVVVTLVALWRPSAASERRKGAGELLFPRDELAAVLALVAIPLLGYVLGRFVTGAFHERYVLQAALGIAILIAWWAAAMIPSRRTAVAVVGALLLVVAARQAGGVLALVRSPADPLGDRRLVLPAGDEVAPVVVSHALAFLPMVHYSAAGGGAALVYLARPDDVVRQLGGDTAGRALTLLSRISPMQVEPYDTFVGAHRRFYVFGPRSWLIPTLLRDNATVELLRQSGDDALYAVSVGASARGFAADQPPARDDAGHSGR